MKFILNSGERYCFLRKEYLYYKARDRYFKTSGEKAMKWQLQKIDCGYEFLGGYQYLDVCGSIMRDAQLQMGYISNTPSVNKSVSTKFPEGYIVNFSSSMFGIMQEEPGENIDQFFQEFKDWQPLIWGKIDPLSAEKLKLVLDFSWPLESEEEVFLKLRKIDVPLFHTLSDELGIPELLQNLTFMFKSGSTQVECTFQGTGFCRSFDQGNSIKFFATERQQEQDNRSTSRKKRIAGNDYSWAVEMKIAVIEESPEYPCEKNNWGTDLLNRMFRLAVNAHNKIKKVVQL